MAFSEKEMQYLITKFPNEFFNFPIEILASEVSLPKNGKERSERVDILAKDKKGFIIIELKINTFDKKAYEQLMRYSRRVEKHWNTVSRQIGISPKGATIPDQALFSFLHITENSLQRVQKKHGIDFNEVLSNSEWTVQNAFMYVLNHASVAELNRLFSKTQQLIQWGKKSRTNYEPVYKSTPLKIKKSFSSVRSQTPGVDVIAENQTKSFEFELKVRAKLGKNQLIKYKREDRKQLLFLISNDFHHYYEQLKETRAYHLSWDDIYDAVSAFSSIPQRIKNVLNKYRYHFYQGVLDETFRQARHYLEKKGDFTISLNTDKFAHSQDAPYYFCHFKINRDFGPLKDCIYLKIGMHADTCDKFTVLVLNPEDYFTNYPAMRTYYDYFLFEEHLNMSGIEMNSHPFYSIDVSDIRSLTDITPVKIRKIAEHIRKTALKYHSVMCACFNRT